ELRAWRPAGGLPRCRGQEDEPGDRTAVEQGGAEPGVRSPEVREEGGDPARAPGKPVLRPEGAVGTHQEGSRGLRDRAPRRLAGRPIPGYHHGSVPPVQLLPSLAGARI